MPIYWPTELWVAQQQQYDINVIACNFSSILILNLDFFLNFFFIEEVSFCVSFLLLICVRLLMKFNYHIDRLTVETRLDEKRIGGKLMR